MYALEINKIILTLEQHWFELYMFTSTQICKNKYE